MTRMLGTSTLAAAVTLALASQAVPARAADPAMEKMMQEVGAQIEAGKMEKCYGVARAGKNDCAAEGTSSCAGTATKDFDKAAFVVLPAGTCDKLAGSTEQPS